MRGRGFARSPQRHCGGRVQGCSAASRHRAPHAFDRRADMAPSIAWPYSTACWVRSPGAHVWWPPDSRRWRSAPAPEAMASAAGDRTLQATLVARWRCSSCSADQTPPRQGLIIHITSPAFVTIMAIAVGARAWGLYQGRWPVPRLGQLLMDWSASGRPRHRGPRGHQGRAVVGHPTTVEVNHCHRHQAAGAGLLALGRAARGLDAAPLSGFDPRPIEDRN